MNKILAIAILATTACAANPEGTEPAAEAKDEQPHAVSQAITHGALDGDAHPQVVLVSFQLNGTHVWRCTGTLLNATTVLTAGHCTDLPENVTSARVFIQSDVQAGIAAGTNNYPGSGGAYEFDSIPRSEGGVISHPLFATAPFFIHDVGVVKLPAPGVVLPASAYGTLPAANSLDALQPGRSTGFTAVGYGLQQINDASAVNSKQISALKTRMSATPYLVQINTGFTGPQSLLLSNNASTGGTCFGDSGGPNFIGDSNVVGGVTSFGLNGACGGTGGVFRMDRQDVLDFIASHLN